MHRKRVSLHSLLPFEVPVTSLVGQLQTAENCRSVSAFPYTKKREKRGMKVETKEVPSRLRKGLWEGALIVGCGTCHEAKGLAAGMGLSMKWKALRQILL
jgi:hypothetical protein